jgi:O-methyltransferase domain
VGGSSDSFPRGIDTPGAGVERPSHLVSSSTSAGLPSGDEPNPPEDQRGDRNDPRVLAHEPAIPCRMPPRSPSAADALGVPIVPPSAVTRLASRFRRGLARTRVGAAPGPLVVLEGLFGLWDNRVLGLLVELAVPELLHAGAQPVEALAVACGADADALDRVLRYAAGRGFVRRDRHGNYRANKVSDVLRADHPYSWRPWVQFAASDWFWLAWRHVGAPLRGAGTAMQAAHGAEFFEYVNQTDPHAGAAFNGAMAAGARMQGLLLRDQYDFSHVRTLCDVGGGTGTALGCLLDAFPQMRGILFDLPEVVGPLREEWATRYGDRAEVAAGDFFAAVPAGADVYTLLAIVHDWDDARAEQILANVAAAMPPDGRVLVIEAEIPASGSDDFVNAADLLMLVLSGGRERMHEQFERLFRRAGLRLVSRRWLPSGSALLEAAKDS